MTQPDRPVPPLRAVRIEAKCPVCRHPIEKRYQPFCSKRCADIDLGRWLKEGYRVPTDETPAHEGEAAQSADVNRQTRGPTGQRG
jgi:uncharacterized protein